MNKTEKWVQKAQLVHGDKYDYSKSEYVNSKTKLCIICPEHGEFWQEANSHLQGHQCSLCLGPHKYSTEEWIIKANIVHNNKYIYDKTVYINSSSKVIITCPIHGDFRQRAGNHLIGKGCSKCYNERITKTQEDFIKDASLIHNSRYDYSNTIYVNSRSKVSIKCNIHGNFLQTPHSHLQGRGCPICNYSKGELLIYNWLKENKIPFKAQFELITPEIARNTNLMIIDFFVIHNNKQYFIEYDGRQHFEYKSFFHKGGIIDFEKELRRDKVLNEFCELHKDKVTLIRFKYNESNEDILKILKSKFEIKTLIL